MIKELIDGVADKIRETLSSYFNVNWIPEIVFWYWWLFVLFLIVGAIIWLFGWSKTVRIIASMVFLFGAIFVAGGQYMVWRMEARDAAVLAKKKKQTPPPPPPKPKWPWE